MIDWFISAAHAATQDGGHHGGGGFDPMHQFVINRYTPIELFGYDASFTNASLWMVIATTLVTAFLVFSTAGAKLVPGRLQSLGEISYEFVANMVRQNAGTSGMPYFPIIFTLFMFILSLNLLGMIPIPGLGQFTVTSHIIVTFALAAFVFVGVTLIGIFKHGFGFLKLFVPSGVPIALLPLISVIEIISYFTRPISLSVRLFANMMAGHTMLAVFGSFVVGLGVNVGLAAGGVPLIFMVLLMGLEILIAFLQAYVFAVLSCIYLSDSLHAGSH
ncbi:ATP synthase F0F1 subunit A [Rhodomicrobium udaipurense JA643]|nr:ATP synthase F0F1 subunit A [Rhodomicrobium udaipurense JA643]